MWFVCCLFAFQFNMWVTCAEHVLKPLEAHQKGLATWLLLSLATCCNAILSSQMRQTDSSQSTNMHFKTFHLGYVRGLWPRTVRTTRFVSHDPPIDTLQLTDTLL